VDRLVGQAAPTLVQLFAAKDSYNNNCFTFEGAAKGGRLLPKGERLRKYDYFRSIADLLVPDPLTWPCSGACCSRGDGFIAKGIPERFVAIVGEQAGVRLLEMAATE
jgi:hypothetical protein